jgi:hypothetical protein
MKRPAVCLATVHMGRPRNAAPSKSVTTWVPTGAHDALIRRAKADDVSVSALIRRLVLLGLP